MEQITPCSPSPSHSSPFHQYSHEVASLFWALNMFIHRGPTQNLPKTRVLWVGFQVIYALVFSCPDLYMILFSIWEQIKLGWSHKWREDLPALFKVLTISVFTKVIITIFFFFFFASMAHKDLLDKDWLLLCPDLHHSYLVLQGIHNWNLRTLLLIYKDLRVWQSAEHALLLEVQQVKWKLAAWRQNSAALFTLE